MRSVLLFAFFFSASFLAVSQSNYNITAGYTFGSLIDDEGRTFESEDLQGRLYSLSSAYLGFSAEKPTHRPLAVRFELNYVATGGMLQANMRTNSISFISRVEFHQLQLPVVVKYALTEKFHVHAGGYLGAQLFTRYGFVFYSQPMTLPWSLKKKLRKQLSKETNHRMHPVSLGVFGGADYILSRRFHLTARYNYTFTNMSREPDTGLRMHFLQTGLSYRLNRTVVLRKNEL